MQYKRHSLFSRIIWAAGILPLMMFGISAHAETLAMAKNTVMVTPQFDFSSVIAARQHALDHRVILFNNNGSTAAAVLDHGGDGDTSGSGRDSSGDGDGGKDSSGHDGHHDGGKDTSSHHGQDSTGTRDSSSSGDNDSTSDSSHHGQDSTSGGDRDSTTDSSSHHHDHGRDTSENDDTVRFDHHNHGNLDSLFRARKDSIEDARDSEIIGHLDSLFTEKDSLHREHRDSLGTGRDSLGTGDKDSTSDSTHHGDGDTVEHGRGDTVRFHHTHGNLDSLFRSHKDSVEHERDSDIVGHLDSVFEHKDSIRIGRHDGDTGRHHTIDPGSNGNAATGKDIGAVPATVLLQQNYPNPFQSSTGIQYALPSSEDVTITVYSLAGQKVVTLATGVQSAGSHSVTFDASSLSAGMYFYTLRTGDGTVKTLRMIVTK
ncbi:MAG TPA: T9SS type A sorting domain-containing protein [Candidatus Kapabacteria bacterium]|nr:T9SS type A sorting domain-containing protein [Candidatus Kapabacteria bacterium]